MNSYSKEVVLMMCGERITKRLEWKPQDLLGACSKSLD